MTIEPLENGYKEEIRKKKNKCIVNIMKGYQFIYYGREKVLPTLSDKKKDEMMLRTIIKEIEGLLKQII